jgi:undecaprenyl diphosphate synthase
MTNNNIPEHVAIIMDGNGRWARARGLPRSAGHREGVKRLKEIVSQAAQSQVKAVTFFAFSSENWKRPKREVDTLMRFLDTFMEKEVERLHKNNMVFRVIGRADPLPARIQKKIERAQDKTRSNSGLKVVLAINYGSRQEILDAARRYASDCLNGASSAEEISEEQFGRYLYTAGLPDPDLLIRTSGEMRISNFLLWQLGYCELYFTKVYWPDFKKADFLDALKEYAARERRYGSVDPA